MLKSKGAADSASVKIGIIFSRLGISPNVWTISALIPAALGLIAIAYNELLLSAALFLLSGLVDAIDGAVARVTGAVSNFGAFLDGIIDRYVELLLFMGLLLYLTYNSVPEFILPHSYWMLLLVFGALMPTFIRSYADHRNVVTEPEDHKRMGGIMERAERVGLLIFSMVLGYFDPILMVYLIIIAAVLSHMTAIQRIWFVFSVGRSKNN